MTVYGNLWQSVTVSGSVWQCAAVCDDLWQSVTVSGSVWYFVAVWNYLAACDCLWPWYSVAVCGSLLTVSGSVWHSRVILILMKVEISTSTWFQVVPFCSQISEHFLFSL